METICYLKDLQPSGCSTERLTIKCNVRSKDPERSFPHRFLLGFIIVISFIRTVLLCDVLMDETMN